ncbi:helix-hairpin-helix domain-containing protein [uncultured Fusobacterium sp.]|uniref:ComEA family DNA-binding protein n=1 Tax=uncultured Fusobacterium sp. TaxID=159267 RepID=UPI0028057590|nr:helix-hairpin-helix domain-containing protein [uncultured Fusobacterium sp.]
MKNWILIFVVMLTLGLFTEYSFSEEKPKFKVIMSENMLEKKDFRLDINLATKEEMNNNKIGKSYISKIIDYREKTGGFLKIDELKRIKGIGNATFEKLSKKFKIESPIDKKPLYINDANEELLKYYGFDKKEIKKLKDYLDKNRRIDNNIQLMELLSKKRYEKYKEIIKYDKF